MSITSALAGGRYALTASVRHADGSSFILSRRLTNDAAQDYLPDYVGTVGQLEEEDPGLLGSAISAPWLARDPVYEFGSAEDAVRCIGIASNGTALALEPCGVDAGTLWVITRNSASRYAAFINGTSSSSLLKLTALPSTRGIHGTVSVILSALRERATPASQLWSARPGS